MAQSRRHAVRRAGWWMLPTAVAVAVCASFVIGAVGVTLRVARLLLVPVSVRPEDVTVLRVDRRAGTVTLSDHPDAVVPGRYSVYFSSDRGYARIGDIVSLAPGEVTRQLLAEVRGTLRKGLAVRISGWFYESPAEVVPHYENVVVTTELGPAPAWLVPGDPGMRRWVIQVHGRGVDRREPIRSLPVFHDAGCTSLVISYRNDGVAPGSADGRYALGDTEWVDVESAIEFAVENGATDVVVMGWSMGGALALQAVTRSPLVRVVRGVILESPVIDWVRVLDYQASALRVPGPIRSAVYRLIGRPWGRWFTGQAEAIDLDRLDFVSRSSELGVPVLLMHSDSDTYVPSSGSRALARLRPDIVTYLPFAGAGHTRLWNYDPERWNAAIADWLAELPALKRPSSP